MNKNTTDEKELKRDASTTFDVNPEAYVIVKNGFNGRLVYISPKTGERYIWNEFGDEQEMQLRELRAAKNSSKKFFENNWFMFDEDWVIDYLGLRNFYKNSIPLDEFDSVFEKSPAALKKIVAGLPDGQKKSLAYRASMLVNEGKIDSMKTISAIEEAFNIQLIEK